MMDLSYLKKQNISKIACPSCHSVKAEAQVHASNWVEDDDGNMHMRVPFLCRKCGEKYVVVFKPVDILANAWTYGGANDESADTAALDS